MEDIQSGFRMKGQLPGQTAQVRTCKFESTSDDNRIYQFRFWKNIFSKNTTATTKFSSMFKKIDQRSEGTFFYDVSVLPPDHQKIIISTSLTGIAVVQVFFYKNLKLSLQVFTNHRNL